MTSSLMNFLVEKYLSNFVEIDTSQTKASIFSGIINLKNLKIKQEIFKSINLPYFEVVNGYIGNLLIKLKMPRFYKYPINVEVDKVFIHIRQIKIDKKMKDEEIKSMEEYKYRVLKDEEELRQNWENVGKEESNIFQQIMNDLQIEIKQVIIHIDDTISYKAVPYTLGLILNKLVIKTTKKNYNLEENITENILQQKIKYKVFNVDNFSIYLDCFDNLDDFNNQKLAKITKNNDINKQLAQYYEYCLDEFKISMKNKNYHQYILYKMEVNINVKTNDNYIKTNEPHRIIYINIPRLYIRFSLKQIKTLFKAKAYNNLYNMYQNGIAKKYYKKKKKKKAQEKYIKLYQSYYEEKYFKKTNENIEFPKVLTKVEKKLSLETIREMRNKAYNSLSNSNEYYKIKKELDDEENKWLGKNVEKISELKEQLKQVEQEILKEKNKDKINIKLSSEENFNKALSNLNLNLKINFELNDTKFYIYENVKKKSSKEKLWTYDEILIKCLLSNFTINGEVTTISFLFSTSLDDVNISHGVSKNQNYQKLLFGETSISSGKVLKITFEKNPKNKYSDYKLEINFEKKMHILYDNHILSYMTNKIMSILNTTLNFEELNTYAADESVHEYIKQGYVGYFNQLKKFQHFNIELNINLLSPIILLPLDPFDVNNNKCILLSLGSLKITSELPPRQTKDVQYITTLKEDIIFDKYKIDLIGTSLSTISDCSAMNNNEDYKMFETYIIKDFDLHVICKKLIEIKNPHFDNLICELSVKDIRMKMDEFQILFLIDYLGNFMKDNKMIFKEKEIDKLIGVDDEIIDEEGIIADFLKNMEKDDKITEEGISVNEFEQSSDEDKENNSELDSDEEKEKEEKKIEKKKSEKSSEKESEELNIDERFNNMIINTKTISTNYLDKNKNKKGKDDIKKDAHERIMEIKKDKKQMKIIIKIEEMTLSIKKIHPDLQIENFLELEQSEFEIEYYLMDNGDMLTLIRMNNIGLFDLDIDENKYPYVEQPFQCLIKSDKKSQDNKVGFIDMTNLYRTFEEKKEIDTIFDMNNLNIIISFDSLLRIYQFMMYYYEKYNEKMYEISHLNDKKNISVNDKDALSNKDSLNKKYLVSKTLFKLESDKKKQRYSVYRSNIKKTTIIKSVKYHLKKEKYDTKITIVYNMKNTIFKIPLNPKNFGTPIIFFNFNLIYNQYMRNVYTNTLKMPKNLLIETVYKVKDSKMNLLISKVDLDIIFNIPEQSKFIYDNEKLISNFRMSYLSSSFLCIKSNQSISTSDINIEPLFCKFGVRQIGKLLEFYNKVNSFWFDFNNIKYIPYMKPEYLVEGKPLRKLKKKRNFRDCVKSIMIAMIIRKGIKMKLDKIRNIYANNKKKPKMDNISEFNNHSVMNINFRKILITFYDNMTSERTLLLNFNIIQIFMKLLWNSKVKDKENVSNMIYEMITGDDLPIEKYNINTLAQYMKVDFIAEINYFNMSLNKFEPLMEKIKFAYLMMQTCSFSRKKNNIDIDDMINFNISSNAIKVVNLFLLRYYKKEKDTKEKIKLIKMSDIKKSKMKKSTIRLNTAELDKNKEVYLVIVNFTELNLTITFDSDSGKKHKLISKGTLTFYKPDIFSQKNKSNKTILNASIDDQAKIRGINFSKNNTRQYKLRINQKNKEYDIYISVKVSTSGLLKQVHFCPSITIFNDTNFKEIELFIKNPRIKFNSIIVKQNDKTFIPITWFLCEEPMSSVFMKIKNNIEPIKIYDHINQLIVEPLDEEEKSRRKSRKKEIEKSTKKNRNKYWNQNEINALINECDNRKDNKIINFIEDDQKYFFSIDYYFVQSKEIPELLKKKEKEHQFIHVEDTMTMTTLDDGNNFWYEYLVYIRPFAVFYNQLPINLMFTLGNSNVKKLKTFKSTYIYNDLRDEDEQVRITFNYDGDKYRSPYFDISNKNFIELINNDNQTKENLFCCILKSKKKIDFHNNLNNDVTLIEFSTSSYEYIFYFKYLIMNKLPNTLWAKPYRKKKSKKEKISECELKSGTLTLMNHSHIDDNKYIIREENSRWSEKFDLRTINKKGTIEIDTEIEKEEKNIINTKDISCILSWGKNYENSRILIFQEQFLIHNKLKFDIYYRQENDKEKTNHFLKKETLESICRVKEKKIFRLGLFDSSCGEFNYSSPFDIGILKAVDLLIKINEFEKDKYDKHFVYTNNEKNYYILIRIESYVFDDGLVYLTISNPYLPSLKIENETEFPIKIYEEKGDERPLVINGKLKNGFPFVWKNNSEEKNELFFEICGTKTSFSFAKYEEKIFEIEFEEDSYDSRSRTTSNIVGGFSDGSSVKKIKKVINFSVSAKNKGLTRCLNITETEYNKNLLRPKKVEICNLYTRSKSKITSISFSVKIKGIGFSIINENMKEIFYISFYMFDFKYLSNQIISNSNENPINENTENFELFLKNFQIDYCLNDSVKYIVAPKAQFIPSYSGKSENLINSEPNNNNNKTKEATVTPFISFLITSQQITYLKTMEESKIYRQIDFIIQEFFCKIDQYTLTNLLNIINEFMGLLDYSKKLEKESDNQDTLLLNEKTSERIEKFKKSQKNTKVLINYLFLSSIKLYLTIRLNLNELASGVFPNIFAHIFGTIGNTLARFTDVPIYFTEKGLENIYISLTEIFTIIYKEYKRQGTAQILKLIGSSDIIGNPVKLLEGIGTGFYELINEPRKSFVQGPLQFGKGIAKGIGKLLSGIIGGAFGVVESISGTLYSTIQGLTSRHHENFLDEDEGPTNIAYGALEGIYGGFKELKKGFTGVVLQPYHGAKKNGVKGFFKGLGKGLVGLAISPFSAALKLLHSLAVGTKNTVNFIFGNSKVRIRRFRYPRVLDGEEEMKPYDYVKAFAKSEILKIMKIEFDDIIYTELFKCENNGFNKGLCLFVKMQKIIIIIYRSKIVFKEVVKNIKYCEIHYTYNNYFIVRFVLKKGNSKGFRVNIKNYKFVFELYDLIQNFKKEEDEKNKNITIHNLGNENELKDIYELKSIDTIVEGNSDEEISAKSNTDNNITNKQYEQITVKEINTDNINNINNINNVNAIEQEQNKLQGKKRDIIINNFIINYNNNINLKKAIRPIKGDQDQHSNNSNHNDTILNNESVYSSIKENSNLNNDDIISFNKKINLNDSLNGSSIKYNNSNDNFLHHLYFSDSSSSVSNK